MNKKKLYILMWLVPLASVIFVVLYFMFWLCFRKPMERSYSTRVVKYKEVQNHGSVKKYLVNWSAEFVAWPYRDWCDDFYKKCAVEEIIWPIYLDKFLRPMDLAIASIHGPIYLEGERVISVRQEPTIKNNFQTLRLIGERDSDDNTEYIIDSKISNYVYLIYARE